MRRIGHGLGGHPFKKLGINSKSAEYQCRNQQKTFHDEVIFKKIYKGLTMIKTWDSNNRIISSFIENKYTLIKQD
jgi:hypothetical protein